MNKEKELALLLKIEVANFKLGRIDFDDFVKHLNQLKKQFDKKIFVQLPMPFDKEFLNCQN